MVKIRYAELPAGLHVAVESDSHDAVIYLLPGLTSQQRQAALLRARSGARMGQGPALPRAGLARAIMADRVKTTVRNGAAALWRHPVLVLMPLVVIASSAIVFCLTSVGGLTSPPQHKIPASVWAPAVGDLEGTTPSAASSGHHRSARPAAHHSRAGAPPSSAPAGAAPADPGRSPSPSPSTFRSPSAPPPSPTSSPDPSPTPSPTGTCINVGLLGVCLGT